VVSVCAVFCASSACIRENALPRLLWVIWIDCVFLPMAVRDFVFEQRDFFHLLFAAPVYTEEFGLD